MIHRESCQFCHRPITPEFVYRKPTAANKGLCTRKDCRKARKRDAEQALREGEVQDGDATTDSNKDTPGVQYDHVVRSDIDDDTPKLLKVRLASGSNGENELLERAHRAAEDAKAHPPQPRREVFNPPVDHRTTPSKAALKLEEKVQETERSYIGHPIIPRLQRLKEQMAAWGADSLTPAEQREWAELNGRKQDDVPSSETLTISIRNDWLKEKDASDQEEQRAARQLLLTDVKPLPANAQIDELSLRLLCKLTPRDLAHLIKDEKFCQPFVAEDSPQRWVIKDLWKDIRGEEQKAEQPATKLVSVVGPDGIVQERVCTVVPMSRGHQRRIRLTVSVLSGAKPNMTTALTDAETSFYKDLAASNLTVLEMVEKHGAWSDDEICDLENRIIRHAAKVRLVVLPTSVSDDAPGEYGDGEMEEAIKKTQGEEVGGQIHSGKRGKYDNQRGLDSFRTPLPHKTGPEGSPSGGSGGPEHDDYGEDSGSY